MKDSHSNLLDSLTQFGGPNQHPSPRSKKRSERGLPTDDALRVLARSYLTIQHRLWPNLAKNGVLKKLSDDHVARMANEFRQTFISGQSISLKPTFSVTPWKQLGACYLRYSDDGSNPRSLDQQLLNVLNKARQFDIFIPWECVFADAGVTGTISTRQGYVLAKEMMSGRSPLDVQVLVIDEIGRASRDAVESLQLGRLIDHVGKRLIGASDGFDSTIPGSKTQLSLFATVHEYFVDQLKAKVHRGMHDAFALGKNIGKPALGYKLIPRVHVDSGRAITDSENRILTERVLDDEAAKHVLSAFELYVDGGRNLGQIGREFNQKNVGGSNTWASNSIRQLLQRSTYHGVEFYAMTRRVVDPATGHVRIEKRPKAEWKRREVPELRIVSDELFERAQSKLARSREAYSKHGHSARTTRTEFNHKTLVRPVCGVCGKPMWLGRAGKYASYICLNGRDGKLGCTFKKYKAARIIDDVILNHIREVIIDEEFVNDLVTGANQFMAEQPSAEQVDLKPIDAAIRKKQTAIEKINAQLEVTEATNLDAIFHRVSEMEKELKDLKDQRSQKVAKISTRDLVPITKEAVLTLLTDMRELLNGDHQAAAEIISRLTGPVTVTPESGTGKKSVWQARFTLNAAPVMLILAHRRSCPTTNTWEFLNTCSWTMGKTVCLPVKGTSKSDLIAAEAKHMAENGASIQSISRVLGTTWQTAKAAIALGQTTGRQMPSSDHLQSKKEQVPANELETQVLRLRETEHWSFNRIAKLLKRSPSTISHIYDRLRPKAVLDAVDSGTNPKRGTYRHIPQATLNDIQKYLRMGYSIARICDLTGCSESTIYRERTRLRNC